MVGVVKHMVGYVNLPKNREVGPHDTSCYDMLCHLMFLCICRLKSCRRTLSTTRNRIMFIERCPMAKVAQSERRKKLASTFFDFYLVLLF